MSTPSQDDASLTRDRPRRVNIPVPARAQQAVEARLKDRSNHEDLVAKHAARTEVAARPAPADDSNNFIFSTPIPVPQPRTSQPQGELEHMSLLASYFLRKLATRDARDLRVAYEQGELSIDQLRVAAEEAADDPDADEEPQADQPTESREISSVGQKGKGRANDRVTNAQVGTNYKGITVDSVSHPLQSRHAIAAAKQAHAQANRDSRGSPLVRTDTATIYPGEGNPLPITPSSIPRARVANQPVNSHATKPGQPARPPPTSEQRGPNVQTPVARPPLQPAVACPSTRNTASSAPMVVRVLVPATQASQQHMRESQELPSQVPPTQPRDNIPARSRAPAPINARITGTTVRSSNKRAESRHTPINIGSRPPNRSKPNDTHTNASRPDQRRDHAAVAQDRPIEDEVDAQDAIDIENLDAIGNGQVGAVDDVDVDNEGGNNPAAAQTKVRKPVCIKGHKPETQPTITLMVDIALAYVVAAGTYDHPTTGLSVATREDYASKAWALACRRTTRDYPMLTTHLKVLDAHVTTRRSRAKTVLIPEINKFFGFDIDTPADNAVLSKELLMDGFHQGDRKRNRLDFRGEYLRRACRAVAFSGTESYTSRAPKAFSPFPMAFVAFVCTISHHVIYCYRDGPFSTENLSVPLQMWVYRHYLKLLVDMEKHQANIYSIALGTISDYCRDSLAVAPIGNPADDAPMREWSPDALEPYESRYPNDPSDDEMTFEQGDDGFTQLYDDDEEPKAGPSRHHDPEDDEVPTDAEMEEDVDVDDNPVKPTDDEEFYE
ncbi:hypothetical protein BDV93DRAFT_564169 [Ceratobasidium sp. AG-I]|nr:hypothetical protein BDV93DRAFT_564169 [Ceratobasidium sp. AG-I]